MISDSVKRLVGAAGLMVTVVVTGVGCATSDQYEDDEGTKPVRLQEAKEKTLAVEREIADAFAVDDVVSVEQLQEGVLLSCTDDQYQWTGRLQIELLPRVEGDVALGTFEGVFRDRVGYTFQTREAQGLTALIVSGPSGEAFVGDYDAETHLLNVASASICVTLEGDESPLGTY